MVGDFRLTLAACLRFAVVLVLGACSSSASSSGGASPDAGMGGSRDGTAPVKEAGADVTTVKESGSDAGGNEGGPPLGLTGKSWYIAKGASGTSTSPCSSAGTTWTNAWGEMDQINWSCVSAGDTVWIAGGTYSQGFVVGASGTATKPIYIARVLSTDEVPASAPGWSPAFDAQVIVT